MPLQSDNFTPVMSDDQLKALDDSIKTMDPAKAEALFGQVIQAAKDAKSAKEFLGIAFKIIGTAVGLLAL